MDYLEMVTAVPGSRTALIEDGRLYTYRDLARDGAEIRLRSKDALDVPAKPTLFPVKEPTIYRQLIYFLAYSGTSYVPLILPPDTCSRMGRTGCEASFSQEFSSPEKNTEHPIDTIPKGSCMAVLTSGTTGTSRLWYRTFESWYGFFQEQNQIFGLDSSTRIMVHGSLAFTGNLNMYLSLLSEGAAIITCTPVHPPAWNQAAVRHNANAVYMIPSKLRLLARTTPAPNPRITVIISGSQHLGLQDIRTLKAAYPQSRCTLYYGASELSFVTYIRDSQMNENPACVGTPFPGIKISTQDNEITVSTPYRVLGIPDPYSPGDLGYIGQDSLLYLLGRKDNVYNIHGRKISAAIVENALLALDEVEAAAVTLEQEALTAYVVPNPRYTVLSPRACLKIQPENPHPYPKDEPALSFTRTSPQRLSFPKTLQEKLKHSLPPYQIPRKIILVEKLPENVGIRRGSLKTL